MDPLRLPTTHSVYWAWDDAERLWVHNSDDGAKYVWQRVDDAWQRQSWQIDYENRAQLLTFCGYADSEAGTELIPPPAILETMPYELVTGRMGEVLGMPCPSP